MDRFLTFLREVRAELSKVSWPTRSQIVTYTGAVIGISLFMAAFLGFLDTAFTYLLNTIVSR